MAATHAKLLTFDEYQEVLDPSDGRYALYHGELILMGAPKFPHVRAQRQIRRLFESAAGDTGVVHTGMPYRPLPEYESWFANVAYIFKARWDSIGEYLFGAPELVVEILSPSNRPGKMADKQRFCLANGAIEFWTVDCERREVKHSTADGRTAIYTSRQEIPLFFGGRLAVDDIFR